MNLSRKPLMAFIWIDDPKTNHYPVTGYMSGEDKPEQVERVKIANLPPEYTYITNIKPHRFKALGLKTQYGIKHAGYYGISAANIAIELGITETLSEKLPVFSTVIAKIAEKLFDMYQVVPTDESYTILEKIRDHIYPDLTYQTLRLDGRESESLGYAVDNSLQKLQSNNVKIKPSSSNPVVSAYFPKTPYFLHLLGQSYPIQEDYRETTEFDGQKIGMDGNEIVNEETIQKLIEYSQQYAGFIRFKVLSMDARHEKFVPLGREISKSSYREWAAIPEIIDLCNYALLELYVGYVTFAEKLPFAPNIPDNNVKFLSYVNGSVNEALWLSLSYKKTSERFTSPIASYIRAYDRIMLRQASMGLVEKGFQLVGFSNGSTRFIVNGRDECQRLRQQMPAHGLIPQLKPAFEQ
ncbi:hypothetical protein [Vibrio agarivorans]|uniref:hypothetical protein n=1 Tax=Vibrio agarivorans TaxID=153622 RepID=UPI0025B5E9FD|nr:hypothetical protein [Vibrio agarivorans]MDN3661072.1 hypothetical protein [Vibrio agarivorans]